MSHFGAHFGGHFGGQFGAAVIAPVVQGSAHVGSHFGHHIGSHLGDVATGEVVIPPVPPVGVPGSGGGSPIPWPRRSTRISIEVSATLLVHVTMTAQQVVTIEMSAEAR